MQCLQILYICRRICSNIRRMRKIQETFLNVLIMYVVTLLKFVEIIRIVF